MSTTSSGTTHSCPHWLGEAVRRVRRVRSVRLTSGAMAGDSAHHPLVQLPLPVERLCPLVEHLHVVRLCAMATRECAILVVCGPVGPAPVGRTVRTLRLKRVCATLVRPPIGARARACACVRVHARENVCACVRARCSRVPRSVPAVRVSAPSRPFGRQRSGGCLLPDGIVHRVGVVRLARLVPPCDLTHVP